LSSTIRVTVSNMTYCFSPERSLRFPLKLTGPFWASVARQPCGRSRCASGSVTRPLRSSPYLPCAWTCARMRDYVLHRCGPRLRVGRTHLVGRLLLPFSADTGEVFRVDVSIPVCGPRRTARTSPQPAPLSRTTMDRMAMLSRIGCAKTFEAGQTIGLCRLLLRAFGPRNFMKNRAALRRDSPICEVVSTLSLARRDRPRTAMVCPTCGKPYSLPVPSRSTPTFFTLQTDRDPLPRRAFQGAALRCLSTWIGIGVVENSNGGSLSGGSAEA
jgi:hypothetical protein